MTITHEPGGSILAAAAGIAQLLAEMLERAAAEFADGRQTTRAEAERPRGVPHGYADVRPTGDELRAMVQRDMTDDEIADEVARRAGDGRRPTKQNVAQWRKTAKVQRPQRRENVDTSHYLPWSNIDWTRHGGRAICHRLRELARRDAGWDLDKATTKRLSKFIARLKRDSLVVDYNRHTDEGFGLVPRDPKLDHPDSIIRRPIQ